MYCDINHHILLSQKLVLLSKINHCLLKNKPNEKNMGIADRVIRILIAVVIAVLYFTKTEPVTGTLGMILLVIGAVFLLTSVISFCPLYTLLGIKTCKTK